jgi:hypothetical protein
MLTVFHGEILYFQPTADQKRKHPYGLASLRLAASRAFHAVWRRVGCRSGGRVPVQAHGDLRRQRYRIEFQSASTKAPESSSFVAIPVTHLAKKPSRCVTKSRATAAIRRKKGGYKVMNNNSTHPDQMRHPGGVLDRSGEAGPGSLTRSRGSVTICQPAASETNPPPYEGLRNRFGGRSTHMNADPNYRAECKRFTARSAGGHGPGGPDRLRQRGEPAPGARHSAAPRSILALVLRQAGALIAAGVVLGVGGAWALTRYLESLLFGVRPHDWPI